MVSNANGCSEIWRPEVEGCDEMREFTSLEAAGVSGFVIFSLMVGGVAGRRCWGRDGGAPELGHGGENVGDVGGVEAETVMGLIWVRAGMDGLGLFASRH